MTNITPRRFILDTTKLEPFEIGALLEVLLTYPGASDRRIIALSSALCAKVVQITVEQKPEATEAVYANYSYRRRIDRASLNDLPARHGHAMFAAQIAASFLHEPSTGLPSVLPPDVGRRSVQQIARFLLPVQSGEYEEQHFSRVERELRLYWRPWRTVLHLATARLIIERHRRAKQLPMFDLQDIDVQREWVSIAKIHAATMRESKIAAWDTTQLIDLVWIEPGCADF